MRFKAAGSPVEEGSTQEVVGRTSCRARPLGTYVPRALNECPDWRTRRPTRGLAAGASALDAARRDHVFDERTADLRALARRVRDAIERPRGSLWWMRDTRRRSLSSSSFFAERYEVSAQRSRAVFSGSINSPSLAPSCAAALVAVQRRISPCRR